MFLQSCYDTQLPYINPLQHLISHGRTFWKSTYNIPDLEHLTLLIVQPLLHNTKNKKTTMDEWNWDIWRVLVSVHNDLTCFRRIPHRDRNNNKELNILMNLWWHKMTTVQLVTRQNTMFFWKDFGYVTFHGIVRFGWTMVACAYVIITYTSCAWCFRKIVPRN